MKKPHLPQFSANSALIVAAFTGLGLISAGIFLLAGLPWALITIGGLAIAAAVILYDPTPKDEPLPREYTTGQRPLRQVDK